MRKHAQACVTISDKARATLFEDIYARRQIEACGLLTGYSDDQDHWYIEQAHPLPNIFNSPVYFEFDPADMLAIELAYPDKIVGVYHSHPTGMVTASNTDRKNMRRVNEEQHIPWVWLIVKGPFEHTRPEQLASQASIIAYYHYEGEGLRHISVLFEETPVKVVR